MNKKDYLFITGIMIILSLVIFCIGRTMVPEARVPVGGLVHNVLKTFDEGIAVDGVEVISGEGAWIGISGGDITTRSIADGDSHSTAATWCDYSMIRRDPSGQNRKDSLPTAALFIADCIPNIGDTKNVLFENIADAAETITVDTTGATTGLVFFIDDNLDEYVARYETAKFTFTTLSTVSVSVMITTYGR